MFLICIDLNHCFCTIIIYLDIKTVASNPALLDMGMANTAEERKDATPQHNIIVLALVFEAAKPAVKDVTAVTKGKVPARIPPTIVLCPRFSTIS